MNYAIALILSVAFCVQTVVIALTLANTVHVENGREPNAGFSIVPMVPLYQLIAVGLTWVLERTVSHATLATLLILYAMLSVRWLLSYRKARSDYERALAKYRETKSASLSSP
jgi:hypothetical protein